MKKFKTILLATICLFAFCALPTYARGHHGGPGPGPRFGGGHHHYVAPAPRYHGGGHHHHHHYGPSRGWYNGALIVGATLAGLELISDIVAPPTTVVRETVYTPSQPVVYQPQPVVVQQPQPVVVQQPQTIYVTPQPTTVVTPTPAATPVMVPATPVVTPVNTGVYWR